MIFLFLVHLEFKSSKSLNPDRAPTLQKKKKGKKATCCHKVQQVFSVCEHCFLAAVVNFSSGSAACLSALPKGNSKGTKLCFSWETTPFGMERYGSPLLFCFPLQSKQQHCKDQGQREKNII